MALLYIISGVNIYCFPVNRLIFLLFSPPEAELPELLPCGYLVGENTNITISLKGMDPTGGIVVWVCSVSYLDNICVCVCVD